MLKRKRPLRKKMCRPNDHNVFYRVLNFERVAVLLVLVANFQPPVVLGQELFQTSRPVMQMDSSVSIAAVGDLMLSSWAIPVLRAKGTDYPYLNTRAILNSADAAIANLEAPFTEAGEPFEKKFNFKVPPEFARSLKTAGINVVNLANNHIMDFGVSGLESTIETLYKYGVQHSGAGMNIEAAHVPAVLNLDGKRVAFFGYSMTFPTEFYAKEDSAGTAYPEAEQMVRDISNWKGKVDFVIASFHWSAEKRDTPKDYQIYFAHLAIDSGADLVLGHHPHVLQGIELYKNKLIAYSVGNYAFASYSKSAFDSIILKVYLNARGLFLGYCVPINVDNRYVEFQPKLLQGEERQAVITKLQRLSRPLNGGREIIENSGFIFGGWADFGQDLLRQTAVKSFFHASDLSNFISETTTGDSAAIKAPVYN